MQAAVVVVDLSDSGAILAGTAVMLTASLSRAFECGKEVWSQSTTNALAMYLPIFEFGVSPCDFV